MGFEYTEVHRIASCAKYYCRQYDIILRVGVDMEKSKNTITQDKHVIQDKLGNEPRGSGRRFATAAHHKTHNRMHDSTKHKSEHYFILHGVSSVDH